MQMPRFYVFIIFILLACEAEQKSQAHKTIDSTRGDTATEKKEPSKDILAPAPCPSTTQVVKAQTTTPGFRKNGPYDWKMVKQAQALSERGGRSLKVFFPLGSFSTSEMANVTFVNPVKEKSQAILILHFSNGHHPVRPGTYTPSAGYGQAFWVTAEIVVRNSANLAGLTTGQAVILNIGKDNICGTFDMQNKRGAQVTGTFVAKLEKR
ncbi:MAG: hypothetical protein OHK0053_24900 [Microscillaceae bacterium]